MKTCDKVKTKREIEKRINFSTFLQKFLQKKSWKANQKPRNKSTGTRLRWDIDPVSKKSHIKVIIVFAAINFCLNDGKRLRVRTEVSIR